MKQEDITQQDERERFGYKVKPDTLDDWIIWEREAVWPEDTTPLDHERRIVSSELKS